MIPKEMSELLDHYTKRTCYYNQGRIFRNLEFNF